jgi:hypothetical protein
MIRETKEEEKSVVVQDMTMKGASECGLVEWSILVV